jgi:hypothetical protein
MQTRKLFAASILLLFTTCAQGQQERRSVLLPESEAKAVAAMYPKSGPSRITGTWEPTNADIDGLEANLHQISGLSLKGKLPWIQIEHPENYFRQYIGVLQAGNKRIYINAFCGFNGNQPPSSPVWRNRLFIISDGGSCAWQSLYDPSSKKFIELRINGIA